MSAVHAARKVAQSSEKILRDIEREDHRLAELEKHLEKALKALKMHELMLQSKVSSIELEQRKHGGSTIASYAGSCVDNPEPLRKVNLTVNRQVAKQEEEEEDDDD